MDISYDPAKNARNTVQRDLPFDRVVEFDFSTAMHRSKKPLIGSNGEVRELTQEDLKAFRPAPEALPPSLQEKLGMRGRGPQKSPTKERITIRLSPEVVESFRASGPGWQGRIDDALKSWLKHHEPA